MCPSLSTCTEVVVVVPYLCDVDCCVACQERRRAGWCLAAVCHGYRTLRAVPRNSALTTSASAFLEVDCCSVKAVSLASIRAVVTFWCVFVCLFVWFWACMTDVFLGCIPSTSDFTVYNVRWLFDWVVVLHWIVCMCVCIVRDRYGQIWW